jgi:GNAT superfamily N-acetyltransferase
VIDKESRGNGVGRALMQFAEEKALQADCTVIEVSSSLRRKAEGTYDFTPPLVIWMQPANPHTSGNI